MEEIIQAIYAEKLRLYDSGERPEFLVLSQKLYDMLENFLYPTAVTCYNAKGSMKKFLGLEPVINKEYKDVVVFKVVSCKKILDQIKNLGGNL